MTRSVDTPAANALRRLRDLLLPAAAFLLMSGCGGGGDGGDATTTPTAVAPSITAQPADQSVTAGQPASFSVAASGSDLHYQWQRNGVDVAGANGARYDIAAATTADSGATYTVVVSNAAGSVTSRNATLAVMAATTAVTAAAGGQVASDDGRVTLSIPPNALTADSTVAIAPAADWTVPAALAGQFSVVAGTTHVITTNGGSFDAAQRFEVAVSTAGLLAVAERTAAKAGGKRVARAASTSGNSTGNLGLVEDCGGGDPIIIILPPSEGDYAGTSLAGCPADVSPGGGSSTTISVLTWTPTPSTPVPSGNVIWESQTKFSLDFVPDTTRTVTRGDTWIGAMPASIAVNSVGETETDPGTLSGELERSLVTLVDGNGQRLAQALLPVKMTAVVLDGPGNFYIALGSGHQNASYVSRYALQFSVLEPPSFVKLWERTLTGAPASGDGNDIDDGDTGVVEPSVVGTSFAVDPVTGDLVALAGNGSSSGSLTDDEIARLTFDADGFVVRLDRSGNLVAATPVVSLQRLSHANVPLDPQRFASYAMRLDPAGNAYVAGVGCCDASGQNAYGISGLTLKKIDRTGALLWDAPVASPDDVALFSNTFPLYGPEALAIDGNGNAYLTYYRNLAAPPFGTHLYVSKVAGDSGTPSGVGYITAAVDGSGYGLVAADQRPSYVDDSGVLYIALALGQGSHLVALDAQRQLLGTVPLPLAGAGGGLQVDPAGNIYLQEAGAGGSDWIADPSYLVDLKKLHL